MTMRLFTAAAFAAAALAAMPATAADLNVTGAGIYNYAGVSSTGSPAINTTGGVFRLTGTGTTGSFDFDAFCVDLGHTISAGFGSQNSVNLHYNFAQLTTDGYGNPLTSSQVKQMKGLATLGFSYVGDPTKSNDIAAIQAAIWQIEHPGAVFASSNGAVNALISTYVAMAPGLTGNARYIVSVDQPQSQGMFVPGVPEPATWAMLITGFGLVGFAVRRKPTLQQVSA